MEGERVWVPDPKEGFIAAKVVDLAAEGVRVQLEGASKTLVADYDRLYPAMPSNSKSVADNCALMYLNEATLLDNVRVRYKKDEIYTYVANILIAVNPYFEIPHLYSSSTIGAYRGKSLGTMKPHVFALADKAYRDMKVLKESQSVIISGESGAGKTESTKYVLRYLCDNFGHSEGKLEEKILNANPVLEAFGNAKTTRNNNSSRFGKFMEIHFDTKCVVNGGYISHYLLERARVVKQSVEERNYHIFYQLCAGADKELGEALKLSAPDNFNYLGKGCSRYFVRDNNHKGGNKAKSTSFRLSEEQRTKGGLSDPMLDDVQDFITVDEDLGRMGLSKEEKLCVYTTLASILHLGNVCFEDDPDDNRGGCRVTDASEQSLLITADLMGIEADELRRALTARVMQAAKVQGTVIMVPLRVNDASNARDALAKAIYSRLFDYIVKRINESIPFTQSAFFIGVLDIAGFEYFAVNGFEQFCINYSNEKLQQFFNQRILKDEQNLYSKEGLGVRHIEFVDNEDCIELIEHKTKGIFGLLDEESKLPRPSAGHFTETVHRMNASHFRLALPRKSRLREHREIGDDAGFLVRHFAGAVCYSTHHFIEKNNDALHASLEAVVKESKHEFLAQHLFSTGLGTGPKGKLTFISVGNKFKSQLSELMNKLESTGTSFIRCIKPNVKMVAHTFEGSNVLSQLQCAGMTSVLELMQQGYPSRTPFADLYQSYSKHLSHELARLDPRLFCKALFKALGLDDNDFKFGLTKVFFRPGKFAEFDQMLRADPENIRQLVAKVKHWILASRWKKAQWGCLMVIKLKNKIIYRREALITLQKHARRYLVQKQHLPRIKALKKLKVLRDKASKIAEMASKLKNKTSINANDVITMIDDEAKRVRSNPKVDKMSMERNYDKLVNTVEKEMKEVRKRIEEERINEEREKARRVQEEMEREKQRKRDEEQLKAKQEEEARLERETRQAHETRRREEEALVERLLKEERAKAEERESFLSAENARLKEQMEQERRDHELALRLAQESGHSSLEEQQQQQQQRASVQAPQGTDGSGKKKFDLSKWKYAELRDAVNTSCDMELLEACREEFHRRLKVYHEWKAKNRRHNHDSNSSGTGTSTMNGSEMRAPESVLQEAARSQHILGQVNHSSVAGALNRHRFFRIPFVRPGSVNGEKGWWYAHFDGDWIARQMEVQPNRDPILLVAGRDDVNMCELRLEETGLTRKRGAEIEPDDFEREWRRHNGRPYISAAQRQQQR